MRCRLICWVPLASVNRLVTILRRGRGMHQHTGQPPQFAPLLMRRVIIQAYRRPRLIDQHAALVAGDEEAARAGLLSACAAREVSRITKGAVEVVTRFSSDSALTGRRSTFTPSSFPADARLVNVSQLRVLPRLTSAFFRRRQSSAAERDRWFSERYRRNHPAAPCQISEWRSAAPG